MKKHGQLTEVLSGLLLFFIFVACLVATLAAGVRVYQGITQEMDAQYGERTCLSYVAAKLRHADQSGRVTLAKMGELPALALEEQWEDQVYVTYLYYYEGAVRELYMPEGSELLPEDGLAILEVEALELEELSPGFFRIGCQAAGRETQTFVSLRSEGRDGE